MTQPAQVQRQHREDDHLGREGFGARDPDLGPGVEVDSAIGLAGDGAADGIDNSQGGVTSAPGLAQRSQRIGRFARLAEHEDKRAIVERGVAIAELAGVLDLNGQVRQALDLCSASVQPGFKLGKIETYPGQTADYEKSFATWIIPFTMAQTNIGTTSVNDLVNLEFDLIAKYLERMLDRHVLSS